MKRLWRKFRTRRLRGWNPWYSPSMALRAGMPDIRQAVLSGLVIQERGRRIRELEERCAELEGLLDEAYSYIPEEDWELSTRITSALYPDEED